MAYKRISPQPVTEGGTGAQTFTSHGVLLGNTTSAITATAAGTTGQVLTGVTGSAPTFQSPAASSITITGDSGGGLTGNSFTFTGGTTGLTFAGAGSTETLGGTLVVNNGGTGNTTFTAYSVICAGTTSTGVFQNVSGLGSSGNVLTSNGAGALPTWQTAGAGTVNNIFTYGAYTLSTTAQFQNILLTGTTTFKGTAAAATSTFPIGGTFKGLSVYLTTNSSSINVTITLYVNGSPTSLVCTLIANTTGSFIDNTHSVSVNAGDTGYLAWSATATSSLTGNEVAIVFAA